MDPVAVDVERALWDSAFALVSAVVGTSTGVFALFRMPLMLQMFHPGSFLVALLLSLLFLALPMAVVELSVGQRLRLTAIPAMDTVMKGGRGLAFGSVLVCSLLCAAYCSTSVSLLVSPIFFDSMESSSAASLLLNNFDLSAFQRVLLQNNSADGGDNRSGSLVVSCKTNDNSSCSNNSDNAAASYSLMPLSSASLSSGTWWSVLALFIIWLTAAIASYFYTRQASLFAKIVLPTVILFWGILCVVAASAAQTSSEHSSRVFHLLMVPTSRLLASGSLWANAASQSLLFLQVGTGFTLTAGSRSKAVHSTVNVALVMFGVATLVIFLMVIACAGTMALVAERVGAALAMKMISATNVTFNNNSNNNNNNESNTTWPWMMTRTLDQVLFQRDQHDFLLHPLSVPALVSVVFARSEAEGGGPAAKALGVFFLLAMIVSGVLSVTLILRSFFGDLSDLHVGMRSPLTVFGAAAACFALSAPMAHSSVDSAVAMVALDQAVVGTILPLLLCAESLAIAFAGWGGVSVVRQLKDILAEELVWCAKLAAGLDVVVNFGNSRLRSNMLGPGGESRLGRIAGALLPFVLKVSVPVCSLLVAFTNLINFSFFADSTPLSKAVYAVVVLSTVLAVYAVSHIERVIGDGDDHGSSNHAAPSGAMCCRSDDGKDADSAQREQQDRDSRGEGASQPTRKKSLPWAAGLTASTSPAGTAAARRSSTQGGSAPEPLRADSMDRWHEDADDFVPLSPSRVANNSNVEPDGDDDDGDVFELVATARPRPQQPGDAQGVATFSPVAATGNDSPPTAASSLFPDSRAATVTWKESDDDK